MIAWAQQAAPLTVASSKPQECPLALPGGIVRVACHCRGHREEEEIKMKAIRNGARLLVVGLLAALMCALVACGPSGAGRGMEADAPGEVVAEVFTRYVDGGDYKALFASGLSVSKIDKALEAWEADGGSYSIVAAGSGVYKEINGREVSLKDGEAVLGVYGGKGTDIWDMGTGRGYAIVAEGPTSGSYYIVDFAYERE
jgi:hypothetical protein